MIRQRLIRTCIVFTLMCGAAQSALASTSANGWSVGHVAAKNGTGAGYCSMKATFQDAQELVIVRDAGGSNSIGVDFKKDVLKPGFRYDVVAHIGSEKRKLAAIAANARIAVMKTGVDKSFYSAMKDGAELSLNMIGQDFNFSLDGSSGALKSLGICASRLKSGGKFADVIVPVKKGSVPRAVLDAKTGIGKKEAELQRELARLRAENLKLAEASKGESESIKAELSRLKEQSQKIESSTQSQGEVIRAEIAQLREENQKLLAVAKKAQEENQALAERLRHVETSGKAVALPSVAAEPAAAAPSVPPVVQAALPAPEKAPAEVDPFRAYLEAARVAGKIDVKDTPGSGVKSYAWVSDNTFGFAQELKPGKNLKETADNFLKQSAKRCKGDFARTVGNVNRSNKKEVLEVEMACMDQQTNAAAAVLFVSEKGKTYVITQEGAAVQMPVVLSKRDSIEAVILNSRMD